MYYRLQGEKNRTKIDVKRAYKAIFIRFFTVGDTGCKNVVTRLNYDSMLAKKDGKIQHFTL